jgi:hypothetical protein
MHAPAALASIIAYARAGAADHAWRLFTAAGLDQLEDPAALNVKGRLLKDQALRSEGEARRRLYREAAEAYRSSAALQLASYPLINAASLMLLAGERAKAEGLAGEVLAGIETNPDEPETP